MIPNFIHTDSQDAQFQTGLDTKNGEYRNKDYRLLK